MAKKEYSIGIEQTRYKEFKIEADSPEEALRIISDAYFKEAIKLDDSTIEEVTAQIMEPEEDSTDAVSIGKYWFLNVLENS
jgi:hypothetical protein